MEDLPEAVALMDPIDLVTELNEGMIERYPKYVFILAYATFVGFFVSIGAALMLIIYISEGNLWNSFVMAMILIVSIPASWYAFHEKGFLDDYRILAAVVNRGLTWDPLPQIPEGQTHVERFLNYLKDQDDRFEVLYTRYPEKMVRDAELKGKSKEVHKLDLYYEGRPRLRDWRLPFLDLYIRVVPEITKEIIDDYKDSLEDILQDKENRSAVRFFLLQVGKSSFSDDIIEHVNTNLVVYERIIQDDGHDWYSPIEIIAEDPEGHYNIGSFYFG